jgi:hypothetical protein
MKMWPKFGKRKPLLVDVSFLRVSGVKRGDSPWETTLTFIKPGGKLEVVVSQEEAAELISKLIEMLRSQKYEPLTEELVEKLGL